MRSYNQFCPVAKAAEIFCERWTALIIRELAPGGLRFSQIQRGVPLASPSLLTARLRQLEKEDVVRRERSPDGKAWIYRLTDAGQEFVPLVIALGVWGQKWSRRELAAHEVDLGLMLWALEKGADAKRLGPKRRIVEFHLSDQPAHKRHWWFLNEDGRCELCIQPPDRDSDVHVTVSLPDLIRIWRGDIKLARAIEDAHIEISASRNLQKAFCRWFPVIPMADIRPARDHATNGVAC